MSTPCIPIRWLDLLVFGGWLLVCDIFGGRLLVFGDCRLLVFGGRLLVCGSGRRLSPACKHKDRQSIYEDLSEFMGAHRGVRRVAAGFQ